MTRFLILFIFISTCFLFCKEEIVNYHPNGKVMKSCHEVDGLEYCEVFDTIGRKIETFYQLNGFYHGTYQSFYSDGKLKVKYEYREGLKHGNGVYYDKKGFEKANWSYYEGESFYKKLWKYSDENIDSITLFNPIIKYQDSITGYNPMEVLLILPIDSQEYMLDSTFFDIKFHKYKNERISQSEEYFLQLNKDLFAKLTTMSVGFDSVKLNGVVRTLDKNNNSINSEFYHTFINNGYTE